MTNIIPLTLDPQLLGLWHYHIEHGTGTFEVHVIESVMGRGYTALVNLEPVRHRNQGRFPDHAAALEAAQQYISEIFTPLD